MVKKIQMEQSSEPLHLVGRQNGLNKTHIATKQPTPRRFNFVYQVFTQGRVVGGGPLAGSREEARMALEDMISSGEITRVYWSGASAVTMLDKDLNVIVSYNLCKIP